ncbi:MAG: substrate-binding domain-containing protein [Thermodesulfobacteriota bacterium]|nr:substrate-binding domain-containing protein [Thermodesulfobacteriota bacterium]
MDKKDLPIIPSERGDDLHNLEIADSSDLVLFMAGNQFMAMKEIVSIFQKEHPDVEKIFCETLPPGLELKQILSGGAVFKDKILDVYPDVYTSVNEKAMNSLERSGHINTGDYHLYLHNRLALMVPEGNPAGITSVADLAEDNIRISQPDPENAKKFLDFIRSSSAQKIYQKYGFLPHLVP